MNDEARARGKLRTDCIRGRENRFKAVPIPNIVRRRILAQTSRGKTN
jgi:hypothetical protein